MNFKKTMLFLFFAVIFSFSCAFSLNETKERKDIPLEYTWDTESIYNNINSWEADYAKCEELLSKLYGYKGKLAKSPDNLLEALTLSDNIMIIGVKLYVYAAMKADEDTGVSQYQGLKSKAVNLVTEASVKRSFIKPEILAIPKEKIRLFMNKNKALEVYKFFFQRTLRLKSHTLSENEEAIISSAGAMTLEIGNIYTMITSADIKFPKVLDENGREIQLSPGVYLSALESKNRDIKRSIYLAYFETFAGNLNSLSSVLNAKLKADYFYAKSKKYNTVLDYELDKDNIPIGVYDNLITTVNKNLDTIHKYYKLRKRLSGLEDYNVYDNFYSIVDIKQQEISYEDAKEIIKKALSPMGDEYMDIINRAFNERWIDVYENSGKKNSGAYSIGSYGTHPFILINFNNNLTSTLLLAHELGHCAHKYLANKYQPYIYSGYSIFCAEVASTINEHLVMKYLLENTTDNRQKLSLLLSYMKNTMSTFYLQTMLSEFEQIIHTKIQKGEYLTKDDLNNIYLGLCRKYYGSDVEIGDIHSCQWTMIQHFFNSRYYVYKYSTSYAASAYIADRIINEGKPAVEDYLNFLKAGDSDYPINLLKNAGVDMQSPDAYKPAVKLFESLLTQAEELEKTLRDDKTGK